MRSPSFFPLVWDGLLVFLVASLLTAGCLDDRPGGPGNSSLQQGTTGDLRAYFFDVGQGDASAILIKDKVILIDAGEVDQGERVVGNLKNLGVTKIDLLVATHPHSDHIGGMQAVLAAFPVGLVLDSGLSSSSSLYEHFLETLDQKKIPAMIAESGQTIDIDPSLRILVLSPPEERIGDDFNTNSIVLRISSGTLNLLYTGDATTGAEEVMEKAGYPLDAQILKVGHHGSSSSGSAAFISHVRPEYAVISLANENPYGYPHREPLQRLQDAGSVISRTDRDGTVLVRSNGETYSVVREKDGGDIWSPAGTGISAPDEAGLTDSQLMTGTTSAPATFTLPVTRPGLPSDSMVPVPSGTLPVLPTGNDPAVSICAVRFNAPGDDTKNLNGEWVRLANRGDGAVLLTGWTISDRTSTEPYRFPAFLLRPGSLVTVYTGSGAMNDTSLYMERTGPLWGNSGDEAVLKDGNGRVIDRRSEEDMS
ncbi:MAG: lamin tail domain-containing protein [Methanoregulaceae archaeon]|nr:lamin tail domain-containing protein [Methanoregulaceae archaeon]